MEWQRQRRDQLMTERTREQSQVDRLEQEVGQLKMELSTLVCTICLPLSSMNFL